jgi:hypothetical protein
MGNCELRVLRDPVVVGEIFTRVVDDNGDHIQTWQIVDIRNEVILAQYGNRRRFFVQGNHAIDSLSPSFDKPAPL